jgi:methylated-DNA-protein-cysteine methyltransferase-like protein
MNDLFKQQVYEVTRLILKAGYPHTVLLQKQLAIPIIPATLAMRWADVPKMFRQYRVISSSGKLSVPSFRERLEKKMLWCRKTGRLKILKYSFGIR